MNADSEIFYEIEKATKEIEIYAREAEKSFKLVREMIKKAELTNKTVLDTLKAETEEINSKIENLRKKKKPVEKLEEQLRKSKNDCSALYVEYERTLNIVKSVKFPKRESVSKTESKAVNTEMVLKPQSMETVSQCYMKRNMFNRTDSSKEPFYDVSGLDHIKSEVSTNELVRRLVEDLARLKINMPVFYLNILGVTKHGFYKMRNLNLSWKQLSSEDQVPFKIIYKWLNDRNRVNRFREHRAKKVKVEEKQDDSPDVIIIDEDSEEVKKEPIEIKN